MANSGVYPPVYGTDIGTVRLLTGDTDATNVISGVGDYLWQGDDEITARVAISGSPQRAAIYILRLVAMTPAMQLKKWSSADLSVDGPAITSALRALIKDIESGLNGEDGIAASEVAMIVPTGAPVAQPALYPGAQGVDLDPTLPVRIM
jgi:hypothetical protein